MFLPKYTQVASLTRANLLCRLLPLTKIRKVSYDGTPSSLAHSEANNDILSDNIETVKLAYDKHSPPGVFSSANPPIVFLHGLFGCKSNNRTVSKKLALMLDRDVYCLDLRNHGASPHIGRMDYSAMGADVERFIKDHELKNPILIGHSMGAKAAMAVCLRKPKLCSLLIPVDNAPVDFTAGATGFSKFGMYVRQLQKIEANRSLKSLRECDSVLAEVESNKVIRQFLLMNMKPSKDGGYRCVVALDVLAKTLDNVSAWPFNSDYSRWSKPALFIRGKKSPYVADNFLNSIAKFFPRFEVYDVDAGHWLISEKPHEFVTAVAEWISYKEDIS